MVTGSHGAPTSKVDTVRVRAFSWRGASSLSGPAPHERRSALPPRARRICDLASRSSASSLSWRSASAAFPELNGGCGSYSMAGWIALAVVSPGGPGGQVQRPLPRPPLSVRIGPRRASCGRLWRNTGRDHRPCTHAHSARRKPRWVMGRKFTSCRPDSAETPVEGRLLRDGRAASRGIRERGGRGVGAGAPASAPTAMTQIRHCDLAPSGMWPHRGEGRTARTSVGPLDAVDGARAHSPQSPHGTRSPAGEPEPPKSAVNAASTRSHAWMPSIAPVKRSPDPWSSESLLKFPGVRQACARRGGRTRTVPRRRRRSRPA
ncbi:hypothetical protein QFZ82_001430 [Streptomyces sp. V4I23]|nr:hypothetical protein [Streptomyces sp. V4I23]